MYKLDGHVREITMDDLKPGTVLREVGREIGFKDGEAVPPFPDHVILKVTMDEQEGSWDGDVELARPYLYASLVGTTSPTALVGVSKTVVRCSRLCSENSIFMLVVSARGQAFKFET